MDKMTLYHSFVLDGLEPIQDCFGVGCLVELTVLSLDFPDNLIKDLYGNFTHLN